MFGMNQAVGMMNAGSGPPIAVNTISLLHFNGSNGGTSFPDANSLVTWTPTNATTSTTQSTVDATSLSIGTTNSRIVSGSNVTMGSGDWTMEFFIYIPSYVHGVPPITMGSDFQLFFSSIMYIVYNTEAVEVDFASASWSTATWFHVALVKTGTKTFKLYLNGVKSGSTMTGGSDYVPQTTACTIGTNGDAFYMDEFRLSNIARYSTNFTPTTVPFVLD
jgi:hypothetical protein